jgi:hydrogenase/urease accessory protein HupE
VFLKELNSLGFLLHHAAVTHGDHGAPPVIGEHHPLIGLDSGDIRVQVGGADFREGHT